MKINCYKSIVMVMVAVLFFYTTTVTSSDKRIINGTASSVSEYPWIVNLFVLSNAETGEGGSCGGSLIHPQWVLTAGHCFLSADGKSVDLTTGTKTTVTIGSSTLDPIAETGQTVQSELVVIHPGYNPGAATNSNDNDIALLKLSQPVSGVALASLIDASNTDLDVGTITTIMGWGATALDAEGKATSPSNSLLKVDQKVVSNQDCLAKYVDGITDNMLCAGGFDASDTRDSCQGDSGGPLVMNNNGQLIQVGITSFGGTGIACGDPSTPGVYAKVSRYKSFIEEQISGVNFVALGSTPATTTTGTTPVNNDCQGAQLDAELNVAISCLIFQGTTYKTGLIHIGNYVWKWSGELAPATCSQTAAACSTVADNLNLTIRQLDISASKFTAELMFDSASGSDLFWNYSSHTAE